MIPLSSLFIVSALSLALGGSSLVEMPGTSYQGKLPPLTEPERQAATRLQADVAMLAQTIGERNTGRPKALRQAERFITSRFSDLGYAVSIQAFEARGIRVANLTAELPGPANSGIVVVGAHYDSNPGSPGANDNASGVAALLELARTFRGRSPARTIRFVAFTNEEAPWFQTDLMGSRVYAAAARKRGERIQAMLSLETIGFFSDRPGSQNYPPPYDRYYPDTGNFIGFVANTESADLLKRCIGAFRATARFPSEGLAAPASIPGIAWSDQWSFWQEGYPAVMVTDTAPFRYPYYHSAEDTADKLDYARLARVVGGLGQVLDRLVSDR